MLYPSFSMVSALQIAVLSQQLVEHDAPRSRDVQRVLETEHRNADVRVAQFRHLHRNAFFFIAEDQAHGEARHPVEQIHGSNARLDHRQFAAPPLLGARGFERR